VQQAAASTARFSEIRIIPTPHSSRLIFTHHALVVAQSTCPYNNITYVCSTGLGWVFYFRALVFVIYYFINNSDRSRLVITIERIKHSPARVTIRFGILYIMCCGIHAERSNNIHIYYIRFV